MTLPLVPVPSLIDVPPFTAAPAAHGLYDPRFETDSCGVAFLADLHGRASHALVANALVALHNLDHRGAAGAEQASGDGAGITVQVPDVFLRAVVDFELPAAGSYAVGTAFLPQSPEDAQQVRTVVERVAAAEGLEVLGWRVVPTDDAGLGQLAKSVMPAFEQVFVRGLREQSGLELDRLAFCLRKVAEHQAADAWLELYFPSLSARTLVYKGMLTTAQLGAFYPDLRDDRFASAIALVHSRFSTNTFPSWPLAHPFRLIAHNGEINTIKGNRNWMATRQALLDSDVIPGDLRRLFPICTPGRSDSATFDEVLELLHLGGRSLPHAVLMMVPEAWESAGAAGLRPEHDARWNQALRDFYGFHASMMEPWDGPACVTFTDGTVIGAVLDRNGLRPGRWWRTSDDLVVLASEAGVLELDPATVLAKGRLRPGRMFLVDTAAGAIVSDDDVKAGLADAQPYGDWLSEGLLPIANLPARELVRPSHESVTRRQILFGYSEEDLRVLVAPMAATGSEPLGSMGTDTPMAGLSQRPRLFYDYFTQLFAQVTNPALDSIREELVTSMSGTLGPERNMLAPSPQSCRQILLSRPVIDNADLAKIWYVGEQAGEHRATKERGAEPVEGVAGEHRATKERGAEPVEGVAGEHRATKERGAEPVESTEVASYRSALIDGRFRVHGGGPALAGALERVKRECTEAIADGATILILSDRDCDADHAPIPSLLLTSAVHQHLITEGTRTQVGLVVESGDCREVHHVALLIGYGAAAVNPYLAFESIDDQIARGLLPGIDSAKAIENYCKALSKGVIKVMSKMGISTIASYTGAGVFESFGLSGELVEQYFPGTAAKLGGAGLEVLAGEVAARHEDAFPLTPTARAHRRLDVGGEYQWRREGELHLFDPQTVFLLQHATRERRYEVFQSYAEHVEELNRRGGTVRGLLVFKRGLRPPVPVDEVEPTESIVRRFATGAMSYGSISAEAHETLAIAMNRIGGKSNCGEGGEDASRFTPDANGDLRRSAVKQVASGRFGVNSHYLVNADDIQIKLAQGAKPGEGGQLPGYKVYPWVAKTRHSTPGVGLISPPPHHDIYSIEDLAQLIHDLKNANSQARVHVKLVAEAGIGTVAAGVAKAHADVVLVSGHDGGTGAAPLTSLKHAGMPWEIGLADAQQTLILNGLRDRITVQVDGAMKTGRDVVVAALLGAEEFGFATAPLIVSGCVMMRVCHLDTCPVGVATQNPLLRERFTGKPEFVVTFFEYVAEQVREILAELGLRSIDEAVGQVEYLETSHAIETYKGAGLDLTPLFTRPDVAADAPVKRTQAQDHGLDAALDNTLIQLCEGALLDGSPVSLELPVRNVNRTVGTMLGSLVTRRYGEHGLPEGTIDLTFTGSAGQSFGAFVPRGITLRLFGDANDYVGKGLCGGLIVIRPDQRAPFAAECNVIAGNVLGYGATDGAMFLRGTVGERFCVRNSGMSAVVEGVGDHALEYMTGGTVVILGPTGRNLAAGMSGGHAYVLDLDPALVNAELVDVATVPASERVALRTLVQRHFDETGSMVAAALLADWTATLDRFSAVVARDYARVLEATRLAQAEGRDVDEAIMAAAVR